MFVTISLQGGAVTEVIGTPFCHSQKLHYCLVHSVYYHAQMDLVIINDDDVLLQNRNERFLEVMSSLAAGISSLHQPQSTPRPEKV